MSNDVAKCGCEGHPSNFEGCKYPDCLTEVRQLREALEAWRDWLQDGNPKPYSKRAWKLTEDALKVGGGLGVRDPTCKSTV